MTKKINLFANLKSDFASGLVVFLVALPLCLGIAMASGAPLFSGIISGVIGGIVVGYLSKSHLSVTGPAAGLTAIILTAITDLGAFDIFLTAVFIAGLIQLALGFIKAGTISNYFPTNVIEGMLAGIGIIIIMKQLPHAFGYDSDFEGDQSFMQTDGSNMFSALFGIFDYVQLGSIIITVISLIILIAWDKVPFLKKLKLIPGALIAVIVGVVLNEIFTSTGSSLAIAKEHLVSLPVPKTFEEFKQIIVTPDFSGITNPKVWIVGLTIAIVASIETLLCIEASDRMDVQKRYTDTNVELKAQGIGNIVSSLLGGLPMTSVVVRSSANNNAGAKSKMSAIIHGVLLLVSVVTIPLILNKIPLATLAAILLLVGYKLAKPSTFKHFWKKGKYQFVPFIATLSAVVFTDLLKGVALGIVISIIFILKGNLKRAYYFRKEEYADGDVIHIDLAQEVSFLNKAAIKLTLNHIPENSKVIINAQDTVYIAHDILDLIHEFKTIKAKDDNIKVKLKGFKKAYQLENSEETTNKVTVEHYYDAAKRKTIKREIVTEEFMIKS
ncbi:SulP family inorganic anion transporter [Flavobacterium gawalongense]|uniref:SulP family inorganic anion transporter n=1 Tax=Flavobacterium gawalongense TaxID=2594432 RepID=A0A553BV05_9FLAO|nr:SulP family inorganic anion transporter [Flavobacterium gawalongense]TRX02815.1 SulP family inorganic anion transporter [Flavobacterium gawalongense]TRX08123.1 SulP family inorganic anion transporter [Flavobacterium gawalongense]TRX11401.1 SulP family inorganic anion transporter [Flavobacterium gawalongense]TRX12087.1 SulP family inorganic anion transporter [Flavobacterium gawalongense]TRX29036.1 SulP family inorganic anion transporter [Flavobacterium gawalongense]